MLINSNKPVNILCFYSSVDEGLYSELGKYLDLLKRQGLLNEIWLNHESTIVQQTTGIDEHVNEAHVILFLLSIDFLVSNYAERTEVKRALERHKAGEARVIPVILRPVHFENSPFGMLQVLPVNARAVTTWPNRDEAFFNISDCLRKVIVEIRSSHTGL